MKRTSCLQAYTLILVIALIFFSAISALIAPTKAYAIDIPEANKAFFDLINPMIIADKEDPDSTDKSTELSTPAGVINELLKILFPAAVLILFAMLSWGGFEMLTGAASEKNLTAGKSRITSAIVGFILLFCSFWIVRIVEAIFRIKILS